MKICRIYGTVSHKFLPSSSSVSVCIVSVPGVESPNGSPEFFDNKPVFEEIRSVSEVGASNRSDKNTLGFWTVQSLGILNRSAVF